MSLRLILGVVGLSILVALVVFFSGGETGRGDVARGGVVELDAPGESAPPSDLLVPKADSPEAVAAGGGSQRSTRVGVDAESNEPGDWLTEKAVDVQVVFPEDTPADELVEAVVVYAASSPLSEEVEGLLENWSGRDLTESALREAATGELRWTVVPVEGARLQIPVPKGEFEQAQVLLDGRYNYLPSAVAVNLRSDAVTTLEPMLGSWLRGDVRFEAGAERRVGEISAAPVEVKLSGWMPGDGSFADGRRVRWQTSRLGEGSFELRGIPTGGFNGLVVKAENLVPVTQMSVRLKPGAMVEFDALLELGAIVRGRVVDSAGRGLSGASIEINRQMDWMSRGASGEKEGLPTTDDDGRFEVVAVGEGKVSIMARLEGYQDGRASATVEGQQILEGVEVLLEVGARLSGVVRWPDGSPAVGASVSARQRDDETDADGAFELLGLGEGPFHVEAKLAPAEDPEAPPWKAELDDVEAGSDALVLTLEKPVGLVGRVVDDLGEPVEKFQLRAVGAGDSSGERTEWESFEDPDGRFSMRRVHDGEWTLGIDSEGYVAREGEPTVAVPFPASEEYVLTVDRAASISGLVLDPLGNRVAGATVTVGAARDEMPNFFGRGGETAETDAEGRFEVQGLKPTALLVWASSEDWADGESVSVELAPGSTTPDLVLTLRVGGTLTGNVYDVDGEPDVGRRITYDTNAFSVAWSNATDEGEIADAQGFFRFERVTPGSYVVIANPSAEEMADSMAEGQTGMMGMMSSLVTVNVEVVDGEEVHVRLGAEPRRPVRLFGQVTLAGEPVEEVAVTVIAEGGSMLKGMKRAETAADGTYEAELDRPGPYVVSVETGGGAAAAFPLDVPAVDELAFDMALPEGGITGRVTDEVGQPIEGMRVNVTNRAVGPVGGGGMRRSGERTDENGVFSFTTLQAGTYNVRAATPRMGFGGARQSDSPYGVEVVTVEVGDAVVRDVDFRMSKAGGIEGILRTVEGDPVAEAAIFVRDERGVLLMNPTPITTDAVGRFRFEQLPVGSVRVSARAGELASVRDASVQISSGESASIELTAEAATMLEISVLDADRNPVRATISVVDESGADVGAMRTAAYFLELLREGIDSTAQEVGPLPPGKYTVTARTTDGREAKKRLTLDGRERRKLKLRLK